jgi:DNA polymerase III epsilon subunit-like protein
MSWFVVDVESDGPAPGIDMFSMISFGVVRVDNTEINFKGLCAPISEKWIPEALAVSKINREQHLAYPDPKLSIVELDKWIKTVNTQGRPVFVSDNSAFDWQFINYYCHKYLGNNPFGFSARRIGDMYAGLRENVTKTSEFKKLRKTSHTHDPVDDAKGNAEALKAMANGVTGKRLIGIPGL